MALVQNKDADNVLLNDVRERSIYRLAAYTNMYDHVVRESLSEIGEQRANDMARNARVNGLVTTFMGAAAAWGTVVTGVAFATGSPLCSAFGMSTLALAGGTAALSKMIAKDSKDVKDVIWGAFQRCADKNPQLWQLPPNQPF